MKNRDGGGKQGGLGARSNVFLHAAAHARVLPLKSDKEVVRNFGKYPSLLSYRVLAEKINLRTTPA